MTDPDPLPEKLPQLQINPSAIRTLLLMLVRVVGIVATAVAALAAFVKTRDLAGFIVWIKSDDFLQLLSALGLLATFGASVYTTLQRKWREVYLAKHVDDEIAIVTTPTPPPAIDGK